ncbi:MAG: insulinase family protein [Planctomycetes bacterium]|nr:insulinase family protein [Planctomycetota bacterium]
MNRFAKAVQTFTFLWIVPAFLAFAPAARSQEYEKVVKIEGITEYKFKNGLRFLSYPDSSSPTITVNMTVLVGSRHEGYGETGMAHLLEHMLFKGCKLYPTSQAMDAAMQGHGAVDYNATTWTDRTNYYETLPASDKTLKFALELEADRLLTSFIRREDLVKEMTVVRNEFEIGENRPSGILNQRMMAVAFEWHNYGKSTIGNRADIERVPVERLHDFYKKYYQIDNVVLIVAGKFDEKKALEHVNQYFGKLKAPNRVLEATYTEEPAQDGERSVVLRRVGKTALVGLMYHIPATAHEDHPAVEVLSMALGATPSGRLYKALVDKGKATAVGFDATAWFDPGILELTATVADGTKPEAVRDIMIAETEKLADRPISKEEATRAVRKYLAIREQRLAKSTTTATEISEWVGAGDWRLLFIHRDRVAKVTADDVNRVAKKYLKQSNRTVGMFIPTSESDRTPIPETPNIAKLVRDFKGGKAVSEGEVFDATPANIEKRVQRFTLSNGLKVAFFPKKTRGDTIVGSITLRFGNEKSLLGKGTPAGFVGSMMMRGTKKLNRLEIQDELDIVKSKLAVSSGAGVLSVGWESKREMHGELLKLMHQVLREPTFPEAELDVIKQNAKQSIEETMVDPQGLASNTLTRTLNPHPKDSIHYTPTFAEALARLAQVQRDDVVKIYREQIGAAHGEIAVVGDFDPEATKKQLEAIFADWKSNVPYQRIPSVLAAGVKASTQSINTPDKENAVYAAGMQFPMIDTAPDYPALELGNYILGGSFTSRLMDRLRQKEGWSYGCGSQLSVGSKDKVSQFLMYAFCNPEVIDKVDKGAIEELNKLLKSGITEDELKLARTSYLEEMKVDRGKDGSLASTLREGLFLNRTLAYQADLEKKIAALTVADVNRAMAARLSSGRLVIVRAGDFNKKK